MTHPDYQLAFWVTFPLMIVFCIAMLHFANRNRNEK